ncbi:hypothetical protein [Streptomyces sp. NPDC056628]|uniref:hypothetical protein n=1 Tax=Streptomyces sp. NPDC056628 TaxID=3345882 RepID=UPI0036B8F587
MAEIMCDDEEFGRGGAVRRRQRPYGVREPACLRRPFGIAGQDGLDALPPGARAPSVVRKNHASGHRTVNAVVNGDQSVIHGAVDASDG